MAEPGQRRSFPVWLLAAVTIVVVLVFGMTAALLDSSDEVDRLDMQVYPPGSQVNLLGAEVLAVAVGRKELGPGWYAVGRYPYRAVFSDGVEFRSQPDALVIVDKADLTVHCDPSAHTCEVRPAR